MQNTSTTKTGTVEFMPSKGKYLRGSGTHAQPTLITLSYSVKAELRVEPTPPQKPGQKAPKRRPNELKVTVTVGQQHDSFSERWDSDKLPNDRQCKKWVQDLAPRLLPDRNATKIKVK